LHGGGFIFGNRTGCRKPLRDRLLEAGYVVISIDYRLAPETKLEEIVEDVKDACKWVREKGPELFNIDPSRIAVGGGSAGGVLALIAGYVVKPRPQALVVVSTPAGEAKDAGMWKGDRSLIKKGTPYDVVSDKIVSDGGYAERMELWRWLAHNRLSLSEVLGFDPESDMERFKRLIPLENIADHFPTTLIVHSKTDRLVPFSQAQKLSNALRAKDIEHEVFVVPDGHSSEIIRNYPEAVAKIVSFLDKHLKRP
jgi:acetyl esterase/lipase